MGRRLEYEVKTSVRLNMSNPQHVKINDVIQNLDPKIFKSKNQFIIDAIQFYIDNYGKETFVIKKKEKERAEYIRSEDIDDIKEEVIEAATNEAISYGGATTAAAEAQGLDEAGKTVSFDELQPGDLIFYSFTSNGRYKNISHVAVYVGNGKVVEALNESLGVVYRDVASTGKIVVIGRP